MNRRTTPVLLAAATLAASSAFAQNAQRDTPKDEPAPAPGSPEQVEQAREIMPRVGTNQTPVMPTRTAESQPVHPGLTEGQDWLKVLHETLETDVEPSTLAEGAFVMGRLGDLVAGPSGLLIFVPDKDSRKPGEGAVLLMPSRALGQLGHEWNGHRVRVSGEIYTYHGRNQLLLSSYRLLPATPPEPAQGGDADAQPAPDSEEAGQPALSDDPGVRELLDELRGEPEPGADAGSIHERLGDARSQAALPRAAVRVDERAATGLEEGELVLRRPARMVRNPRGAWTLVFDNDQTHPGSASTELIVLPCQTLMRMETVAMEGGDAAQMLVSGRIHVYEGDAYIMPTLVQRVRPGQINSLQ